MNREITLQLLPEEAYQEHILQQKINHVVGSNKVVYRILKRSIDARKRQVKINLKLEVSNGGDLSKRNFWHADRLPNVTNASEVIIVGAGPAGLFAAIKAIEKGVRPIVLERGKDVQSRRRDLANINKKHLVNPESNYCFGEGGAGTYSDGKLYTRSKKRGDIQRVMEILVAHGAKDDILYDAHPHIGTNKLPKLIQSMRETIIEHGGEVRFGAKVTDLILADDTILGVEVNHNEKIKGKGVVLATGHSARDIYELLHKRKVFIEAKPFALGVRVEHTQDLIDNIQYHSKTGRGDYLPPSSYSLVHQAKYNGEKVGVFSFCMCPGGFIVPSATEQGEVVVNGMSPSKRDSKFSNSGIVVAVNEQDYSQFSEFGPLAGMKFQQQVEQSACKVAGATQVAPAQRLVDFVENKVSTSLLDCSYQPGLASVNLKDVLPSKVDQVLKQGFKAFGQKMKGYFTNDAQVIGVESRTSSPVRIPRSRETFEHPQIKGLYPCAEGAGFAGGIVSAAMDGEKCVEALIFQYVN